MLGLKLMTDSPAVTIRLHTSPSSYLLTTFGPMTSQDISANIVFAHAYSRMEDEVKRIQPLLLSHHVGEEDALSVLRDNGTNFWLTMWSATTPESSPQLLLALSCLTWELGDYPIFIWSPNRYSATQQLAVANMSVIVQCLVRFVDPQRVFSVFGQESLVLAFKSHWAGEVEPEPFYEAYLTYCTQESFKQPEHSGGLPVGHDIRVAGRPDIQAVAQCCKEFADETIYFPMNNTQATEEASLLIAKEQVWIYAVNGTAVTICAVTRSTPAVAGITKVFTTAPWRKNGFAERLVRTVTREMLESKRAVMLYVGKINDAQHVYDRVGFVGLCGNRHEDVESVLELGFKGSKRGHW